MKTILIIFGIILIFFVVSIMYCLCIVSGQVSESENRLKSQVTQHSAKD